MYSGAAKWMNKVHKFMDFVSVAACLQSFKLDMPFACYIAGLLNISNEKELEV